MLQDFGEGLFVCMAMPSGSFRAFPCVVMWAWLQARSASEPAHVAACLLPPRFALVPLDSCLFSLCADVKFLSERRLHADGRGKGRGQQRRTVGKWIE